MINLGPMIGFDAELWEDFGIYDLGHDDKVLTVFSAPNCRGSAENQGAVAHIGFVARVTWN